MDQAAPSIEQAGPQDRPKRRGRWKPGESGNPTGSRVSKRVVELFTNMSADFVELTAVEGALLQQAARLMARSERTQTAEDAVRLANAATRILGKLRAERRKPAALTFDQYLARHDSPGPLARLMQSGQSDNGKADTRTGGRPNRRKRHRGTDRSDEGGGGQT